MSTPAIAIGRGTLGLPLPTAQHAITVSLPGWDETVKYLSQNKEVLEQITTGYPRFFIHQDVQQLTDICQEKFGHSAECCLLCPTQRNADYGKEFIHIEALRAGKPSDVRVVHYRIANPGEDPSSAPCILAGYGTPIESGPSPFPCAEVYAIFFHVETYNIARKFWQNCGLGISSRYAEYCLATLGVPGYPKGQLPEHYRPCPDPGSRLSGQQLVPKPMDQAEPPLTRGPDAKIVLRRRIASCFVHDEMSPGASNVSEDDVFLFPCGMAAMWTAHQLLLDARPRKKSVVFGFPYTDTLKIVEKSGPGAIFYGHGRESDIDDLESMLAQQGAEGPSTPPILALYTECPSNPLLRTVNIPRLRALADKYDFLVVIDETIGSYANVDVLPYADIIVTSLSKFFGGYGTALGGSLVINPRMRHHALLRSRLTWTFEDTYYDPDAVVMEYNSRDFLQRMRIINANAECVCDFLYRHSNGRTKDAVIKRVWYPKYICRDNYEACRRRLADGELDKENGGYGGVVSLTFTSMEASKEFYDKLEVAKGPSLGTTFTLSCPYTLLGHFGELEWAAEYGADEGLVRVSVGTEDKEELLRVVEVALRAAESTSVCKTE